MRVCPIAVSPLTRSSPSLRTLTQAVALVYFGREYYRFRSARARSAQQGGSVAFSLLPSSALDAVTRLGGNRPLLDVYRYLLYVVGVLMGLRAVWFSVELWVVGYPGLSERVVDGLPAECSLYPSDGSLAPSIGAPRALTSILRAVLSAGYESFVLLAVSLTIVQVTAGSKVIRKTFVLASVAAALLGIVSFFALITYARSTVCVSRFAPCIMLPHSWCRPARSLQQPSCAYGCAHGHRRPRPAAARALPACLPRPPLPGPAPTGPARAAATR